MKNRFLPIGFRFAILLMIGLWAGNCAKAQVITTIAGNGTGGYSGDGGAATAAELNVPNSLIIDGSGNLYIADFSNHRIRKITPSGIISTIAGNGTAGYSGDGGQGTAAELNNPSGVAVDASGNVYVGEWANSRIRKVTPTGIISTLAGNGIVGHSGDGGPATAAELFHPRGIAVDLSGNVYVGESSGHCIRKIDRSGAISTIAGMGIGGYTGDGGAATAAYLNFPFGVAVDGSGNIYFADANNNRIRKVTASGIISTIAGIGTAGYSGDGGDATAAELNNPNGVTIDGNGNVYVTDCANERIRIVTPSGTISTFAGNGSYGFSGDGGAATVAEFSDPSGVAADGSGNVFIADTHNNRIRKAENHQNVVTKMDNETGSSLHLYPNPNNGNFMIAGSITETCSGDLTFEVKDAANRVVKKGSGVVINGKFKEVVRLDRALNDGYYYVRVFAGGVVLARSFVVGR